jgi:tetratricopeptide (TPR) repeat protein
MSTAVLIERRLLPSAVAATSLKAAVRFWVAMVVIGQLIFAFTVASFYGRAAVRGDLQVWNRFMTHGYIPGDRAGNLAVVIHLVSAVIINLAGAIQLIPQIRDRAPSFHRWNGRLYIVTAFTISIAGLYMMWVRGSSGDLSQHLGTTLMAALIMLCAAMALRYALARDFKTHRRWALRLYLVVSASLFIRAVLFLSLFLNRGPFGFDPNTFTGPFLTLLAFAQYLVPLAVLETYFRAQDRGGAPGRFAMTAGLLVLTVALGAGIFTVTLGVWLPAIKKAYDNRKSISETLSATIASSGVDEAVKQYHDFRTAESSAYDFDEGELNALGYQLIRAKKFKESIRILQLNVEAYPQSSNTYDSLGEAYLDDGNPAQAIANYQKSLQLNPKNRNAILVLQKLNAPNR